MRKPIKLSLKYYKEIQINTSSKYLNILRNKLLIFFLNSGVFQKVTGTMEILCRSKCEWLIAAKYIRTCSSV
jgi:hypothetical protein